MVTGGNSGIGKETAAGIAGDGRARGHRGPQPGQGRGRGQRDRDPGADTRRSSTSRSTSRRLRRYAPSPTRSRPVRPARRLLNNAGLVFASAWSPKTATRRSSRSTTSSHFLLTHLLCRTVSRAAPAARVINVSSTGAHVRPRRPRLRRSRLAAPALPRLPGVLRDEAHNVHVHTRARPPVSMTHRSRPTRCIPASSARNFAREGDMGFASALGMLADPPVRDLVGARARSRRSTSRPHPTSTASPANTSSGAWRTHRPRPRSTTRPRPARDISEKLTAG